MVHRRGGFAPTRWTCTNCDFDAYEDERMELDDCPAACGTAQSRSVLDDGADRFRFAFRALALPETRSSLRTQKANISPSGLILEMTQAMAKLKKRLLWGALSILCIG